MNRKLNITVSFFALAIVARAYSAEFVENRILVKFKKIPGMQIQSLNSPAAQTLGVMSNEGSLSRNLQVIRYSTSLSAPEAAASLNSDIRVEWAQPDYLMRPFVMPKAQQELQIFSTILSDPPFQNAPTLPSAPVDDPRLKDLWGMTKILAKEAWKTQKGSRKIIVADIDTGIDYNHEDLINNLWTNPKPNAPDLHGYDFANNDNFPADDFGHGSHTAGTIGATGSNGIGVSGVNQQVSIMALKFITSAGSGTTSDAVRSIDYAIANGARVMSNSWGGPADDAAENKVLEDAVARANAADILFVAAAGNDGTDNDTKPMYPAAIRLPNMLTVASTNDKDGRSFFSNFGKTSVHVGAPGSNVLSTVPGNKYEMESGTSMACPHVAGLAALILAEQPTLTAVQVKQIIMDTVDPIAGLQGKTVTGGRINAKAAIEKARKFGI